MRYDVTLVLPSGQLRERMRLSRLPAIGDPFPLGREHLGFVHAVDSTRSPILIKLGHDRPKRDTGPTT
jgi:hypothetical protein